MAENGCVDAVDSFDGIVEAGVWCAVVPESVGVLN